MPVYMKVDAIVDKPAARPYPGAGALVTQIRKAYPRGVGLVLIGQATNERVLAGNAGNGIIAILIGLLLPAVQKFDSGATGDLMVLKGALGPTGQIGVVMGDGSVRQVGGATGPVIAFQKVTWESYKEGGVNDTTH